MVTTIQISGGLLNALKKRKLYEKESYEEVILEMIEDTKEISEETQKEIKTARQEIASGKFYTHKQVKKKLGL